MKRIAGTAALAAVLVAAGLMAVPLSAAATPTDRSAVDAAPAPPGASPSTASRKVAAYLAAHPEVIHQGKYDTLIPQPAITGGNGLQYLPYQRSYRGIPVVGGDFVVVTSARGTVLDSSVAQTAAIGELSVRPKLSAARAAGLAKGRMTVTASAAPASVRTARLVVLANPTPRLAWESEVTGVTKEGPSKLAVYIDAGNGKVLNQRE